MDITCFIYLLKKENVAQKFFSGFIKIKVPSFIWDTLHDSMLNVDFHLQKLTFYSQTLTRVLCRLFEVIT